MTATRIPEPGWGPFAAGIRHRLTRTFGAKDNRYGHELIFVAPDETPQSDGQIPANEADDANDDETETVPVHRLSVRQLQLTLRLAAIFRHRAGLAGILEPGSITLMAGIEPAELRMLTDPLWLGFLPPGCWIGRQRA